MCFLICEKKRELLMKNKNIFREISEGLICLHYAQFSSIIFLHQLAHPLNEKFQNESKLWSCGTLTKIVVYKKIAWINTHQTRVCVCVCENVTYQSK